MEAGGCPELERREKGGDHSIETGTSDLYKQMGDALTGDDYPIVGVSWKNAQSYAQWLTNNNPEGKTYRLPTEAEWEYAARAATDTAYSWGMEAKHEFTNHGADECCDGLALGNDEWFYTTPVDSFIANPFGLKDMHGNVWEWVEDCWQNDCNNAPQDGTARTGCDVNASRILRGGSWSTHPRDLHSAGRGKGLLETVDKAVYLPSR